MHYVFLKWAWRKLTKTLIDFKINNNFNEDYESEADQFAKDLLIPPEYYEPFINEHVFSEQKIRDFASLINVDPGIVVGRLQKEELLPYTHLNKLKKKYDFNY